jgi:hypothetical protein
MSDILNVKQKVQFDNRISRIRNIHVVPDNRSQISYNDLINLKLNDKESYIQLHDSCLLLKGRIKFDKVDPLINSNNIVKLVNNFGLFLFKEISYSLNGVVLDLSRTPGLSTSLKDYVSLSDSEFKAGEYSGIYAEMQGKEVNNDDTFEILIPLKRVLGLFEDFTSIIMNCKHELQLIRQQNDANSFISETNIKNERIELIEISWQLPKVEPSAHEKIKILKILESGEKLTIPYRSWILREEFLSSSKLFDTWPIFLTSELCKPRYAVAGFQTGRNNNIKKDASKFDHCDIKNMRLSLNTENYPYNDMLVKFPGEVTALYHEYCKFQPNYYTTKNSPLFTQQDYKDYAPLIVINCTQQQEGATSGTIDVRLRYESYSKFPTDSILYVLLFCDMVVEYTPFTGTVRKLN